MKLARILAAVAVAAVGAGTAIGLAPVSGQSAEACQFSPSGSVISLDVRTPPDGEVLTQPDVTFSGRFEHTGTAPFMGSAPTVSTLTVHIRPCSNQYDAPPTSDDRVAGTARSGSYSWATNFAWNGVYTAQVTAEGTDGQRSVRRRDFSVEVPPTAPTGVKASVADGTVTVTWNKNPEPDVVLYEVDRTRPGTGERQVWAVSGSLTSFKDKPGPGDYNYQVIAIRRDAAGTQGIKGPPSGTASANIPQPPPPTTTAPSGGGSAGNGTTGTTAGSGSGTGTRAGSGGTTATTTRGTPSGSRPGVVATTPGGTARTGKVDLSNFSALLNSRTGVPQGAHLEGAPDSGFEETLPFQRGDRTEVVEEEVGPDDGSAQELAQELINDDGERRRSVSFLAFGLLLFVMSMLGLWVKGEVKRADDLEALDSPGDPAPVPAAESELALQPEPELAPEPVPEPEPEPVLEPEPAPEPEPAHAVEMEGAPEGLPERDLLPEPELIAAFSPIAPVMPERRRRRARRHAEPVAEAPSDTPAPAENDDHMDPWYEAEGASGIEPDADAELRPMPAMPSRVRRELPPLDAPGLDVPDPVPTAAPPARQRVRTSDARRTPRRVPSRPENHRREGGAAVRAGGGGTRRSDRRVPVG